MVEERRSKGEKTCTAPLGKSDRLDTRIDCARRGFYFPPFATAPSSMSPEARQKRFHLGSTKSVQYVKQEQREGKKQGKNMYGFLLLKRNVHEVILFSFSSK